MSNELARMLFLKKKYSMDINRFITLLSVLFFCSCEQLKDVSLPNNDNNGSKEDIVAAKKVDNKETSLSEEKQNEKLDPPAPLPPPLPPAEPKAPKIVEAEIPTKPELPEFSEALLKAVSNWKKIPPTVFPLSSVTIKKEVSFIAKSSSNEIIASAKKSPGEEVVAVGLYQGDLVVAPSLTGRMRGRIAIDDTDFKQGVAYLFELRNKQRAEYEKRQAELAKVKNQEMFNLKLRKTRKMFRFLMIYLYLAILVMGNSVFAKIVAKRD
jgi:hypothetical protein